MGIKTADGKLVLNPVEDAVIETGDELLFLAEDDDMYCPVFPVRGRGRRRCQRILSTDTATTRVAPAAAGHSMPRRPPPHVPHPTLRPQLVCLRPSLWK